MVDILTRAAKAAANGNDPDLSILEWTELDQNFVNLKFAIEGGGGFFQLPVGTTEQRPASPSPGMVRRNSTTGRYEARGASKWHEVAYRDGDAYSGGVSVAPTVLTDSATVTLDAALSNYFTLTMGGSRTLALSNMVAGQTYTVQIRQDATGGRVLAWPAGFTWPSATPGVLSTAANAVDVLTIVTFDGTTFRAVLSKGFG